MRAINFSAAYEFVAPRAGTVVALLDDSYDVTPASNEDLQVAPPSLDMQRVDFAAIKRNTMYVERAANRAIADLMAQCTWRILGDAERVASLLDRDVADIGLLQIEAYDRGRVKTACRAALERGWDIGQRNARAEAMKFAREKFSYDESQHPRDADGKWTDGGAANVEKVDIWYDRGTKSWVVQKLDAAGNQIGEADYVYSKGEAEKLQKEYLPTKIDVTRAEIKDAVASYQKGLRGMNELLRDNKPMANVDRRVTHVLEEGIRRSAPFPRDKVLYRGVSNLKNEDFVQGAKFVPNSFMSASQGRYVAEAFAQGGALLRITAPAGSRALGVSRTLGSATGEVEHEHVFSSRAEYHVTAVSSEIVDLRLTNDGVASKFSRLAFEYDEAQHPRDEKGQWADGGVLDLARYTEVKTLSQFRQLAEQHGDKIGYGSYAFTLPDGSIYVLAERERRALGSKVSTEFLVAHELGIRKADQAELTTVSKLLDEARAGRGDPDAVAIAKKIDAGHYGPMSEATAAVEVGAVVYRNELLKKQFSRLAFEYDEAQHPRDEKGQWADGGAAESDPDTAIVAYVGGGPGGSDMHASYQEARAELGRSLRDFPERAAEIKAEARAALDKLYPGTDQILAYHVSSESWSVHQARGGFGALRSMTLDKEAAGKMIREDLGGRGWLFTVRVPKDSVGVVVDYDNPNIHEYAWQREIVTDKQISITRVAEAKQYRGGKNQKFSYDESQHPRDEKGQWADGSGDSTRGPVEELQAKADALKAMTGTQRDNLDIYDYGYDAFVLYEAQKMMPKKEDTMRGVTDTNTLALYGEADAIANVGGHPYLATKQEDPDNEELTVWQFNHPANYVGKGFTTDWADKTEAIKQFKEHLAALPKGAKFSVLTFADIRENAADYFEANGFRMAQNLTDGARAIIQQELTRAVRTGDTKDVTVGRIYERLIDRGFVDAQAVDATIDDEDVRAALADAFGAASEEDIPAYLNTLVRTNVFEAMNEARFAEFTDPALGGYVEALEYSAILDDVTTEFCRYMDGRVYAADNPMWDAYRPPNHYNCRSLLIPITKLSGWDGTESDPPEVEPATGFVRCGHQHVHLAWDEAQHPRHPQGEHDGGKWEEAGGPSSSTLLATKLRQNGGFTYVVANKTSPVDGYVVALYPVETEIVRGRKVTAGDISQFILKRGDVLKEHAGNAVGAWFNPDNGATYLDVSRVVTDRAQAEKLGNDHVEESIYDLGTGDVIWLAEAQQSHRGYLTREAGKAAIRPRRDAAGDSGRNQHTDGEKEQVTFEWDEAQHPRYPEGEHDGGKFAPKAEGGLSKQEQERRAAELKQAIENQPPVFRKAFEDIPELKALLEESVNSGDVTLVDSTFDRDLILEKYGANDAAPLWIEQYKQFVEMQKATQAEHEANGSLVGNAKEQLDYNAEIIKSYKGAVPDDRFEPAELMGNANIAMLHTDEPGYEVTDAASAWDHYTGNDYRAINTYLRTGEDINEGGAGPTIDAYVGSLDRLADNTLSEAIFNGRDSVTVFRGVWVDSASAKDFNAMAKVGGEWSDPAFLSTSTDANEAWSQAANRGLDRGVYRGDKVGVPVILQIEIPKGQRGFVGNSGEGEIVLPRDTALSVVGHAMAQGPLEVGKAPVSHVVIKLRVKGG